MEHKYFFSLLKLKKRNNFSKDIWINNNLINFRKLLKAK